MLTQQALQQLSHLTRSTLGHTLVTQPLRYTDPGVMSRKWEEHLKTVWRWRDTGREVGPCNPAHYSLDHPLVLLPLPPLSLFLPICCEDLHPVSVPSHPPRPLKTHALGYRTETDSAVGEELGKSLRCSSGSSDARGGCNLSH